MYIHELIRVGKAMSLPEWKGGKKLLQEEKMDEIKQPHDSNQLSSVTECTQTIKPLGPDT